MRAELETKALAAGTVMTTVPLAGVTNGVLGLGSAGTACEPPPEHAAMQVARTTIIPSAGTNAGRITIPPSEDRSPS